MNPNRPCSKAGKTFCYWSIGDKEYAFMTQTLINSARKAGIEEDFHVFSDRKIKGAITHQITHPLGNVSQTGYFFKLKYLKEMQNFNYDYYLFLDADSYFVRKPRNPLTLIQGEPMHIFLETDLTQEKELIHNDWWCCPLKVFIQAMRDLGVKSRNIYNINGGFWIVNRDYIEKVFALAEKFREYLYPKVGFVIDEAALSYCMHILCHNLEKHLLKEGFDIYGHEGERFNNKLPDGKPWMMTEFFTGKKTLINPAIVHCFNGNKILASASMNLFERLWFMDSWLSKRIKNKINFIFLKRFTRIKHR